MSERASLTRVTAPTLPVVTLGEAKGHLALTGTAHDAELEALIEAATGYLDGRDGLLGRAIVTQTWEARYDCWPRRGVIELPLPPLQSVTWVKYLDAAGALQTWDASNYQVDSAGTPGRIALAYDKSFPALRGGDLGAVEIRFVAGYGGPGAVPRPLKLLVLELVGHYFRSRGGGVLKREEVPGVVSLEYAVGGDGGGLPGHVEQLIDQWKIWAV